MRPKAAGPSLAVLFLINTLNFYDRQALGAVLEPLRREFHFSDTQLGGLTTTFTVLYAIAGLPLGRLADTWSRKRLLAIGMGVWSSLTAAGALAAGYGTLLATRLGVGVGEAVCAPAATSWLGDITPPERRARAMAWFMMAIPVGGMLSFALTGPLAQAYGWRIALALAAAPAVLLLPMLAALPEPARESAVRGPMTAPLELLRIPAFLWIVVSGAVVNFALYTFSTFLPAFLTRVHGLSVARAGVWAGVGTGAAGVLGALAGGYLGDRYLQKRLVVAAIGALLAAPPALGAILLPAGAAAGAVALLMLAYGLLQTYYGLVYASIQDLVAPSLRGTAMAVYFMAMYLCGASLGPLVTGGLSDALAARAAAAGLAQEAARAAGLHQAMYVIPAFAAALAVVLWIAARRMPRLSGVAEPRVS